MHRDHTDLLERISKFEIDRGDEQLRFADRLASENGWTREFAQRVIHEYKRFVFMAMTAGHPVTPSKAVDQAWHLHLTYTRSYWDELCSKVLRLPLHHDPSRGGSTEDRKFEQWYGNTLASYKRVFGDPPRDIWPRAQVGTLAPQEANAWSHTVKQHRTASRRLFRIAATVAILAAAAMAAFACTNQAKGNQTSGTTAAWIVVGVVASVIVFIIAMIGSATRHDTRQHQQHHGGSCGAMYSSPHADGTGSNHKQHQSEASADHHDGGTADASSADGGASCAAASCGSGGSSCGGGSGCGGGGCGGG